MLDTPEKLRRAGKWIVGVFISCILVYLGFRHIDRVAAGAVWLLSLAGPMLLGFALAMVFNVPMSFLERNLKRNPRLKKAARPLAIVLAMMLVFGIFVGVLLLVIPELVEAIKLLIQIAGDWLTRLAQMENQSPLMQTPLGQFSAKLDINWLDLKAQLEGWFRQSSGIFVNQVVGAAGTFVGSLVSFFIGLVFAVYILAGKETLKGQILRLMRAWLSERMAESLFHIAAVCSRTFRLFIAGQATEAVILGTLCMIGMAILQIPYAPMVGALVGVTALIPVVGAFVGTIVGAVMILTVNPIKAVVFVVFLLILQQVEGNMIYPRVVGSKINLPAIWVLAAVTIGGNLGGPIGMLLGVPAASAAYALLKEATQKREQEKKALEE